jgi:hypothetical protein
VSPFRREVLSIGLSGSEIAVARRDRAADAIEWAATARTVSSPDDDSTAATLTRDVGAAVAAFGSGPINARITIACDLMRWWTIELLPGMSTIAELRQYAALRFEEIFAEPSARWVVRADWTQPGPVLCAALPSAVAEAFEQHADRLWRPTEIVPSVARLQRLAVRKRAEHRVPWLLACALCDRVTLLWHLGKWAKRVASIRVSAVDPWPLAMEEIARRESFTAGNEQVRDMVWAVGGVGGAAPGDAAHAMHWLPPAKQEPSTGAQLAAVLGCTA